MLKVDVMFYFTTGSGLVTHWEQESGMLLASGDVRFIRIWDSQKELKVQVRGTASVANS